MYIFIFRNYFTKLKFYHEKKKLIVIHKVRGLGQFLLPTKTKKNLVFVDTMEKVRYKVIYYVLLCSINI